jgi:DNA-binding transcriptional MerR regulator
MIQAFSLDRVRRITGLTRRQLVYWDETDVLRPSIAPHESRSLSRLYSFADVLRLQAAKEMRDRHILPGRIRELTRELEERGFDDPLLTLRFVSTKGGREVFWIHPGTEKPMSARAVDQTAEVFDLQLTELRTGVEGQIADLLRRRPGKVVRLRRVRGNQPVLDGTRVPTAKVALLSAGGWETERILRALPNLTDKDVSAALRFEKGRRKTA